MPLIEDFNEFKQENNNEQFLSPKEAYIRTIWNETELDGNATFNGLGGDFTFASIRNAIAQNLQSDASISQFRRSMYLHFLDKLDKDSVFDAWLDSLYYVDPQDQCNCLAQYMTRVLRGDLLLLKRNTGEAQNFLRQNANVWEDAFIKLTGLCQELGI